MHTPPRIALLAALGLIALLPSLPLGRGVNASDHKAQDFHTLNLRASGPVASQRSAIDIALVPPGADWPGSLAQHIPGQPLLVSKLPLPYDVIMRSVDGLWSARKTLYSLDNDTPIDMQLEPRGILSGHVYADGVTPSARIIITAQSSNGHLYTQQTGEDGSFRFPWLPEAKYTLSTPPTIHGACRAQTLCITGKEIRLNLQPSATQGEPAEVIGSVRSHSGSYQESLRVKLWPLDLEAAPQATDVVWSKDTEGVISGEFNVPATVGEQYVLSLVKDDILPASFTRTPIQAPSDGLDILFDDTRPHASLTFSPETLDPSTSVTGFEVAVSWGQGVTWRSSDAATCVLEGVPCNTPISWLIKAPGRAPEYGEMNLEETRNSARIAPVLRAGWGEGLKVVHADGTPASGLTVLLDGEKAGLTDDKGTLTLRANQSPQHLSLRAGMHRLFGGASTLIAIDSIIDRDELGRLLLVLLPRD